MWLALNKLGIFQCEGCGGNGKIVLPHGNGEHPCSGCDGYGWVIGKEKDDGMD
jgi:DnaJ-class molecular chaperone